MKQVIISGEVFPSIQIASEAMHARYNVPIYRIAYLLRTRSNNELTLDEVVVKPLVFEGQSYQSFHQLFIQTLKPRTHFIEHDLHSAYRAKPYQNWTELQQSTNGYWHNGYLYHSLTHVIQKLGIRLYKEQIAHLQTQLADDPTGKHNLLSQYIRPLIHRKYLIPVLPLANVWVDPADRSIWRARFSYFKRVFPNKAGRYSVTAKDRQWLIRPDVVADIVAYPDLTYRGIIPISLLRSSGISENVTWQNNFDKHDRYDYNGHLVHGYDYEEIKPTLKAYLAQHG